MYINIKGGILMRKFNENLILINYIIFFEIIFNYVNKYEYEILHK